MKITGMTIAACVAALGCSAAMAQAVGGPNGPQNPPSPPTVTGAPAHADEPTAATPGASITEVAFEMGFNDSAYFARCFRQRFGVAPREWRTRA